MRTCIRHLPKVLVIQLKRFDYDWERETSIKFNDYFEFPRELDLGELLILDEINKHSCEYLCTISVAMITLPQCITATG